jgi:predicted DNA-binding transcriptional regulator AlpA
VEIFVMKTLLRFHDLKQRNIARSWAAVARLIKFSDFPPGRLLSPSVRVWSEDEIDAWFASRPTQIARPLRGRARELVARRDAAASGE